MATSRQPDRRELARRALGGYVNGPAAAVQATAEALAKAGTAEAVLLVEGISDQIAVETAALCRGRDLGAERTVVVPIGGAHAIARFLTRFGPLGARLRVAGLYDVREEGVIRRGLTTARVGTPQTRADLETFGFHACVNDLEDELIRAVGIAEVEALFATQGDLPSFRSMQNQPAWRDREPGAQMRRYLSSGSRRKLRYARLLVEAAARRGALPGPLDAVLAPMK
jgi:hypothetical protein